MATASARSQVPPFAVMEVLAAVEARREAGLEVFSLCAGQPGGSPPAAVRERAAQLLAEGAGSGYTPALGTSELRSAIAGHYAAWYGLQIDPAQVAVTTGSSGAFLLAFLAALDHGARVAVTRPGYPAYRNILAALGCEVVDVPCGPQDAYRLTPALLDAAAEGGRLDAVIVASPANPTGTMLSAAELGAVAGWCAERGARLISDEIYHGITYGAGRGACAWAADRSAIVISSASKYWAMPGWRLGWALLPEGLVGAVDALAGNVALCPPALAQLAGVEAFTPAAYAEADAEVARYAEHRRLVLERLPALGWTQLAPPDGAFYVYGDVSAPLAAAGAASSEQWCRQLLDATGVALTPGTDFDPEAGHHTARLSFACGTEELVAGLDRLAAWTR